jgi:hypothetical protein
MGRDLGRAGSLRRFCRNNFEELVLKVGLFFRRLLRWGGIWVGQDRYADFAEIFF